jgi:hypothetical protein
MTGKNGKLVYISVYKSSWEENCWGYSLLQAEHELLGVQPPAGRTRTVGGTASCRQNINSGTREWSCALETDLLKIIYINSGFEMLVLISLNC